MLIDPCEFVGGQFDIAELRGNSKGDNCNDCGNRDTA